MMPTFTMRVFRGEGGTGGLREYRVDAEEGMVVLDVIHRLQATQATDLAVRWNCKAGKCGSCSAEIDGKPRLMCMTRMDLFQESEPITVTPIRGFPLIRDLVTNLAYNYEKAKQIPPLRLKPPEPDGTYRMMQEDIDRIQEFHKCIECFLCQNVCHVIRDHEENKKVFAGPRFFIKVAGLAMHPLDTRDRIAFTKEASGVGLCNITKCCTEVCPEHIHITDNAIIPLKERVADEYFDPVVWLLRKLGGGKKSARS
jgi:succinate dehydrogenase / fumarate reductase iron-sulfur subunit